MLQVHVCMQCQAFSWLICGECAGGAYKDAVGVCAHELGDPQLALFLARLLEGGQSPLQQHLLSQELLPGHSMMLLGTPDLYCYLHAAYKSNAQHCLLADHHLQAASPVEHGLAATHFSCVQQITTSIH